MQLGIRTVTAKEFQHFKVSQTPAEIAIMEEQNRLLAWCSYHSQAMCDQPEMFEFHVLEDCRGFNFGSMLMYVMAKRFYFQHQQSHTYFRAQFNKDTERWVSDWRGICELCSFYHDQYGQKALFKLDNQHFILAMDSMFKIEKNPPEYIFKSGGNEFVVTTEAFTKH